MAEESSLLRAPERLIGRPCLLASSESVRLEACRDALRMAARAAGYAQTERIDASERQFDWNELARVSVSPGLFAERRLLDLRLGSGKLPKEAQLILQEILQRADPDLQLLLSLPEWSRAVERESWIREFARHGQVVSMWPLKAKDLPGWLSQRARGLQLQLQPDALELLLWRTDGNLLAATQALEKLALTHPGKNWDQAALAEQVADDARFSVFRLIEEAIGGQPLKMRRVLHALRAEGEEPARLMHWLTQQLTVMAELASHASGNAALARDWLRSQRVFEPLASIMLSAHRRHSPQQWASLYLQLEQVDRAAKGRDAEPAWLALERLLLRVALPSRQALAFAA